MGWLEYFKKWASKYDSEVEVYGYNPKKLLKPFIPLIGKRKRGLDIGCGTGKSLGAISDVCEVVLGVEPVEKMAKQAEKKGFRVIRSKGEEIPDLGKFDFISLFASLDYMDENSVAKKCTTLLSQNGFLFLTLEPENLGKLDAFRGFEIVKKLKKRAYEGQDYWCFLLKKC